MRATAASSCYDIDRAKRGREGLSHLRFLDDRGQRPLPDGFPLRKSCNPANLLKLLRLRGTFERRGLTKKLRKGSGFFDDCAANG
jgi:hypothetical protein